MAENKEMGVKTAQRFLKELRHKPGLDYKFQLTENFILLASGNKQNVQQALNNFLESVGDVTPGASFVRFWLITLHLIVYLAIIFI